MSIPKVMGFPIYKGRIKERVAKKYYFHNIFRDRKFLSSVSNIGVGDLIFNCSSFNVRIEKIIPYYRTVNKSGGAVLADLEIVNDKGGLCSFNNCGVEPARPMESIIQYWFENAKYWKKCGDPWHFAKRYEFTSIDENGIATVDYDGLYKKYPEVK